jgi:hypothetical protein
LFPQNAADSTSALSAPTRRARARPGSSPGYQSPRRTSGRTDRGPLLFALIAPSRAMLIAVWRSQEFFLSCTSERERARIHLRRIGLWRYQHTSRLKNSADRYGSRQTIRRARVGSANDAYGIFQPVMIASTKKAGSAIRSASWQDHQTDWSHLRLYYPGDLQRPRRSIRAAIARSAVTTSRAAAR